MHTYFWERGGGLKIKFFRGGLFSLETLLCHQQGSLNLILVPHFRTRTKKVQVTKMETLLVVLHSSVQGTRQFSQYRSRPLSIKKPYISRVWLICRQQWSTSTIQNIERKGHSCSPSLRWQSHNICSTSIYFCFQVVITNIYNLNMQSKAKQ